MVARLNSSKMSDKLNLQLSSAAAEGNLETVKKMLKKGADINFIDQLGMTPLMQACCWGHNQVRQRMQECVVVHHLSTSSTF